MPILHVSPRWPLRLVVQAQGILLAGLLLLAGVGCTPDEPAPTTQAIVTFSNATEQPVAIYVVDEEVGEKSEGLLEPGEGDDFDTYVDDVWRFKHNDQVIGTYEAGSDTRQFHLIKGAIAEPDEPVITPDDEAPHLEPLRALDFEPTYEDPNIAYLPDGFTLPNVYVTMWSKDGLYDLDASSEFVLEFDATLTAPWQELIVAFSQNKIPWGAEGADALTFRVSPETQDIWIRTGFYESWLNTRLFYNSSEQVIQVGAKQRYRIRLTPSDITVSVDDREIAAADFHNADVPRSGHVGFVIFANPEREDAPITYQRMAVSETPVSDDQRRDNRDFDVDEPTDPGQGDPPADGRYHALVIAVEDYIDAAINDLDFPVQDAAQLVQTLTGTYTFEPRDVTFLKNPSQERIIRALDSLRTEVQQEDNLLIFYAGHGFWDEQMEQGFWLPADAERRFRSKWLANSTLRNYLKAIKTQHTLLVSDACFSGGIFKTRDAFSAAEPAIAELYKLPSRKAMTSGALKEVPDKSVFIEYLIKRLRGNDRPYLSAQRLFNELRDPVINNSPLRQVPQFGVVRETGDEGGDFVFRRRNP